MGLASEMKNLSEEILSSFKQRIKETEERVQKNGEFINDVQKTLDGIRKDHKEMADVLNAKAFTLKKDLAKGEKERMNTFNELMSGIHHTIGSIQKEVVAIQTSTFSMINKFTSDRAHMAGELVTFFAQGRKGREQNEKARMQDKKNRIKEFDALMKTINVDLKSLNDEVNSIFKNTGDLLEKFDKEHSEMSTELKAELSKNLIERVNYTKSLLLGFQDRLSEISNENQQLAKKMSKDLADSQKEISKGDAERLLDYKEVMKEIHAAIKGIRKEVKDIQKATAGMIGNFSQDRSQASAGWNKMQDSITRLKGKGVVKQPKEVVKKAEKKETKKEVSAKKIKKTPVITEPAKKAMETPVIAEAAKKVKESPVKAEAAKKVREAPVKAEPKPVVPMTLEEKILDYINQHPKGVRISEMEEPLGETRMKLGYIAKNLLDSGKVQKVDNIYFPLKK